MFATLSKNLDAVEFRDDYSIRLFEIKLRVIERGLLTILDH